LPWPDSRETFPKIFFAALKPENPDDNIRAVGFNLSEDGIRALDAAAEPGIP
jgi:hypothetical protein